MPPYIRICDWNYSFKLGRIIQVLHSPGVWYAYLLAYFWIPICRLLQVFLKLNIKISFFSDLSKNTGLKKSILDCFNHNSEEVKSAASYALGNISLGNLKEYLPFVLNEIETQPKRQYLLLHSLKEVNKMFRTICVS